MPRFDPNESLGFHCNLTFKAFFGALEEKLRGTGVSPAQFVALAQLIACGPLSQSELVSRLSITPATGVRLIDRLERDGWVKRKADKNDSRIKMIVLTRKAIKIWDEISHVGREIVSRAYKGVQPSEIETAKRVLEQLRKNLNS